jgi:hypothetical protein
MIYYILGIFCGILIIPAISLLWMWLDDLRKDKEDDFDQSQDI